MNVEYSSSKTQYHKYLGHDFKNISKIYPNKIAISYYEDDKSSPAKITYKLLNDAAVTVDAKLQEMKLKKNLFADNICMPFIVGIYCRYSPVTVACMLGIMKQGAFFYISEHLSAVELLNILQTVQPVISLIQKSLLKSMDTLLSFDKIMEFYILDETICLINLHYNIASGFENSNHSKNDIDVSYVMTTSGSTGMPKVVYVSCYCIIPNIKDFIKLFTITEKDTILSVSPLSFDPSVVDIFMSLSCGAHLIMLPSNTVNKAKIIDHICQETYVTILQATPSLFYMLNPNLVKTILLSNEKRSLKVLALGGEEFPNPQKLKRFVSRNCTTKFFNLYGVTEISCWASCHEVNTSEYCDIDKTFADNLNAYTTLDIDKDLLNMDRVLNSCPLGRPLTNTAIKVVNDEGEPIENEVGRIVICGERVYIQSQMKISHHNESKSGEKVLFTGDMGYFYKSNLYYIDRKDNIVKHNGFKISLAEIENAAKNIDAVFNCCLVKSKQFIFLYIVPKTGCIINLELIKKQLKLHLSVWKYPDEILVVDELPMSMNGKVDRQKLAINSQSVYDRFSNSCRNTITIIELLEHVHNCIGSVEPQKTDNFINIGGNSLQAISLCNKIQKMFNKEIPLLMQTLFNGSFNDVCELINTDDNYKKRKHSKIIDQFEKEAGQSSKKYLFNDEQKRSQSIQGSSPIKAIDIPIISRRGLAIAGHKCVHYVNELFKNIEIEWKINLGKCIDASPLIVDNPDRKICLIGCHSHKFFSIDIDKGQVIWSCELPDRIESSAAISFDGEKVFIGCYDGVMYCLNFLNGDIIWKFATEGAIKCTPYVDHKTKCLVFGSHDKYLYCLHEHGELRWKNKISNGSIFSSPVEFNGCVYSATLDGYISCNDIYTGVCSWRVLIGKPIFSSLAYFSKGIVFGCVDHKIYCFSFEGKMLWEYLTKGPVFSSPFIVDINPVEDRATSKGSHCNLTIVAIGSHDNCVYLLNEYGALLHLLELSSPIYATPYLTILSLNEEKNNIEDFTRREIIINGAVSETKGAVVCFSCKISYTNSNTRLVCNSKFKQIDGELFSSPVIFDNRLFIGCRDNNFYSLNVFQDDIKK